MAANQNLQSWLIVNCRNELQNKHWNFATNIPNFYKRTFEVIFQKRTEIESNFIEQSVKIN